MINNNIRNNCLNINKLKFVNYFINIITTNALICESIIFF